MIISFVLLWSLFLLELILVVFPLAITSVLSPTILTSIVPLAFLSNFVVTSYKNLPDPDFFYNLDTITN
jgi:peptidoglycan/LPS O-acetylase OafA/YrhL